MQGLRFIQEEFYGILNTLYQSLIKNSRVKDASPSLFMWSIFNLQRFKFAVPIID